LIVGLRFANPTYRAYLYPERSDEMKRAFWLFLGLMFSTCLAQAQETPMVYSDGNTSSMAVLPPMGTFLLIRKNDTLCAIQFTGIWRGNDSGKSSFFHSGDESFRARYAWYLGERVSNTWGIHPPRASGESEASRGRLFGLGSLAFGNGNSRIKCGPILLFWTAPAHVYFSDGKPSLFLDQGNEIAVTRWTKLEDIDPNDRSLQWLRFDKNRPDTVIPLKDQ
jgi:hypothetical protein